MDLFKSLYFVCFIVAAFECNASESHLHEGFMHHLIKAKEGDAESQYDVARCYFDGNGVSIDTKEGLKWLELSASQGCKKAQKLFKEYSIGITEKSTRYFKEILELAEHGDAVAMCDVGFLYSRGIGIKSNQEEAFKWYLRSAESGLDMGQFNAALRYVKGKGVDLNYPESAKWFRLSAEQGFAPAQCELGQSYLYGEGVKQDKLEAIKWLNRAAKQGYARAQEILNEIK